MPDLPIDPAVYPLLIFHCFIGGIATILAKQKGHNVWLWLLLGFIGGTASLMAALLIEEKKPV